MFNKNELFSRQYTVHLPMQERVGRQETISSLAESVRYCRESAVHKVNEAIAKLEKETGKRAVDRIHHESFVVRKDKPAVLVKIEFLLVTK
jgi:hypothetical protein